MNRLIFTLLGLFIAGHISAQNFNMTEIGSLSYNEVLSDIWHYNKGANEEYALVGVNNGLSIVDVSEPSNPIELHFISGPSSSWRDIKQYNDFCYVINETGSGLLIVDLSDVQNTAPFVYYNAGGQLETHHNIWIDEFGYAYIAGHNTGNGGVIILDLNVDPWAPPIVGSYDNFYVHDMYVRNNIMYTAEINAGEFRIIDVTEKTNWVVLGSHPTSGDQSHNIWPTDDANFVFTTDEISSGFIDAYDVSDPTNISRVDMYQSNPGSGVIPHNVHVLNDFVVISYYRDGVIILDGSNPKAMVEVGRWDTSPALDGNGFNGNWGCTPFLNSGYILASDMENGLVILEPNYQRAAFLEGNVTDGDTGFPLNDVTVELLSTTSDGSSDIAGDYAIGIVNGGSFTVRYSKPGYTDVILSNVSLTTSQTNTINIQMFAPYSFAVTANVTDENGNPIEGANVSFTSPSYTLNEVSDANGNVNIPQAFPDIYDITVGIWGYQPQIISNVDLNDNNNNFSATLVEGYYDDFSLDFGWQSSAIDATSGLWELGEPIGTNTGGEESNPDVDVFDDIGDQCYVTGNGGGNAGNDDIDGGSVILVSPEFDLTKYVEGTALEMKFSTWFYNGGGNSALGDDYFTVTLNNGTQTEVVASYDHYSYLSGWINETIDLNNISISLTNTMTLILDAGDITQGHLVEAAFDHFRIDGTINDYVSVEAINQDFDLIAITANPFVDETVITLVGNTNNIQVEIFDVTGKLVKSLANVNSNFNFGNAVEAGVYFISASKNGKQMQTIKAIKTN